MIYKPRRDRWLSVLMGAMILLPLLGALILPYSFSAGTYSVVGHAILIIGSLIFSGFISLMWFSIQYTLGEDSLDIRFFPIHKKIPYDKIRTIRFIQSWESNAATSKDRIEIRYGHSEYVHISPQNEEHFLQELRTRCPHMLEW